MAVEQAPPSPNTAARIGQWAYPVLLFMGLLAEGFQVRLNGV